MKKHLKIFFCYFRLNLASALEYRASFFIQAFGMALSNSTFIFFWWIAFSRMGGSIAGYSFEDVLFIWAVTSTGFGLAYILFANVSSLTNLIVTGELDAYLLWPSSVLLNVLCAKTKLSAYGDFAYGVIIMLIINAKNPAAWLLFALGVMIAACLFTAVSLMANTLSFYLGDATAVAQLATEFAINFSIYPEKIYGQAVRALMYSLIPMGIAVHVPLRLYHGFSLAEALLALAGTAAYCAAAAFFFYRGLKRYESGNMIVMKS